MDLGQDWSALQRTLYPRKKSKRHSESDLVWMVHHSERVIRVIADRDDLVFTTGTPLQEAIHAVGNEKSAVAFDLSELDRALVAATQVEGGIYQQAHWLRENTHISRGTLPEWREHWIVEVARSKWARFFPSSYGILIRLEAIEEQATRSLLLIFKRGQLQEFAEPDLSGISDDRRKDLNEVVKVLRERYRVPVQGFALNRADFEEWSEMGNQHATWKKISQALKQNRLGLYPFRWGVAALIGAKGI